MTPFYILPVAHNQLLAAYHMLKVKTAYVDLGSDSFDRHGTDRLKQQLERFSHSRSVPAMSEEAVAVVGGDGFDRRLDCGTECVGGAGGGGA